MGFCFLILLTLQEFPVSTFQAVAWIIAGLAVGAITGTILAKNQLRRLSKDYQFSTTGKDIVLIVVPIVLFFIFSSILGWSTILFSIYSLGVSIQITRWIVFFNFEKKENMRLMQSWWGMEIFLIPRAPQSNVNQTETNAKNNLGNRVRGWLPQEPTFPKAPGKIDFQTNQQKLPLSQKTDRTGWALVFLALFLIFVPVVYSILTFPGGYSIWVRYIRSFRHFISSCIRFTST